MTLIQAKGGDLIIKKYLITNERELNLKTSQFLLFTEEKKTNKTNDE